jgi:nucleotide-binding universal stress UspA family protein
MKVVIGIDDSNYSTNVLHAVEKRHWPSGTEFKIVNVIEPIEVDRKDIEKQRKEHAETLCEKARHRIQSAVQGSIVFFEIRHGRASKELLESAAEWSADRILVGAHGHTVCPHNLPGSVSRSVAYQAPCHVEVIRGTAA